MNNDRIIFKRTKTNTEHNYNRKRIEDTIITTIVSLSKYANVLIQTHTHKHIVPVK